MIGTPDYLNPEWQHAGRVHDWRNYVTEDVKEMWDTFTKEQKRAIAMMADEMASREEWE